MRNTHIEWADDTWNPIRGCTRVSPGCINCYAETIAHRFSAPGAPYEGLTTKAGIWNGKITVVHDKIMQPLSWKKPRRIFVNSMSDLFHENVPEDAFKTIFEVMNNAYWHQFLVLTKRPLQALQKDKNVYWTPNIWLGVSVESRNQIARIQTLQSTSAAVKFISFEPLINEIGPVNLKNIDWAIVGGESGPGARLMRMDWARQLKRTCDKQGVAFFMKQIGSVAAKNIRSTDKKGGNIDEFPDELQVRQYPEV